MDNRHDLQLILKSGTPIVVIESHDEARLLELINSLVAGFKIHDYRPIFRWTVTDGLQRMDIALESREEPADPTKSLRHIRSSTAPGIYVLLDFHPYLDDPVHVRLLKDIAIDFQRLQRTVILLSHAVVLPPEIERYAARFELSLPDQRERAELIRQVADEWVEQNPGSRVKADPKAFDLLVKNLSGLTVSDTRRLARNAIFNDGAITKIDLPNVMQAKYELLNRNSVLAYEYETAGFADVGGMLRLKTWLEQRKPAFRQQRDAQHLESPKGVMLLGVQGCGKSLAAKAAAGVLRIPLLRLDFATLYNKYHGETERNLREALKMAEVMAPCVLWIDEIEKSIAAGNDNSGTSKRVLGTFLTWLAEKRPEVFVVATANDITGLPPELVRKGRFDEIFFVDLPAADARAEIFALHLRARNLEPEHFDLGRLVQQSEGFSGAEIEQAIVAASYDAFANRDEPATAHLSNQLRNTNPLSVTMAERVAALRAWASQRTVPAN